MKLTPQQITSYKHRWLPGYMVELHSDLESRGKEWCKRQCLKEEWQFKSWSDIYYHTFCFENIKAAQNFEMEFGEYARKVKSS